MLARFRLIFLFTLIAVQVLAGTQATNCAQKVSKPASKPKKLSDIIHPNAVSSSGVFKVYTQNGKVFFEIPKSVFGKDMLWYAEAAKVPVGVGNMGNAINNLVVRWERRGDKVYVQNLSTRLTKRGEPPRRPTPTPAPEGMIIPVDKAVEEAAFPPIMLDFDIKAQGPGGSVLIDVTDVFSSNIPEFSVKDLLKDGGYQIKSLDVHRSYIKQAKAFPRNIEVTSLLTFPATKGKSRSVSILVQHSLTLLPEHPMMPRYYDPRVGYFTTNFQDYSEKHANRVLVRKMILRYRLEKKDPKAAVSEPVKPIVYYVSREVPNRWRPYIKQAVEDWRPALEAAGFKNAIIAKDAPTPQQNPNWDPADTRYSVVRWQALPTANAMGPNIHDPRSGEVISAHVLLWADVVDLAQKWYFAQCAALDPRARHFPMPDALVGEMLRYIVSHEIGHTLGLRHNFRASQAYTVEQLRSPAFTSEHGDVASVMSYGRFNYVAQPGDGVTRLIPKIGPYDRFAINWGYRPIPSATTPEEEVPILNKWAEADLTDEWLLFGGEDEAAHVDPTVLTENIGKERIEATRLGLLNLDRDFSYLVDATTKPGGDFKLLQDTYKVLLDHRYYWLDSVVKEVGGVVETRTMARHGKQFHRVPREYQRKSVRFIMEAGLRTPERFVSPDLLNLFSPLMSVYPVLGRQNKLLDSLLDGSKYLQLRDESQLDPSEAYPMVEYLSDIQNGLWEELTAPAPSIGPLRRELQRHYILRLGRQIAAFKKPVNTKKLKQAGLSSHFARFEASEGQGTDFRAAAVHVLEQLDVRIQSVLPKNVDETTRLHLADCRELIREALKETKISSKSLHNKSEQGKTGPTRKDSAPDEQMQPVQ